MSTLSISNICHQIITPAIVKSGWSRDSHISFREDKDFAYPTLDADYVLFYSRNNPIAVLSVTESDSEVSDGIEPGIENARKLGVLFAFSSNGKGFAFYDKTKRNDLIQVLDLDHFPTPEELWTIYQSYMQAEVVSEKIVREVKKGNNRILLGLKEAGAGVVATAFQIIRNILGAGVEKRALYLTDQDDYWLKNRDYRQSLNNSHPYRDGEQSQYGITIKPLVQYFHDHSSGIYWASVNELVIRGNWISLGNYPSNFFDIIVVDKSHGGGIVEQAKWLYPLQHFNNVPQIAIAHNGDCDKDYFTEYVSVESQTQNYNTNIINQNMIVVENTTHNSFNNNSQTIKTAQNHITISHNKTIINNTKMARQTSYSYQIELAERLKSYLHGLQERLGDVAQNYKNKCNDLSYACMMEETLQDFEMNYMHETISKIADIITQVNENDIPFIERYIANLEQLRLNQ